jgi:radical SAM superfamily enzyme YgiQ (UPF0313 family)
MAWRLSKTLVNTSQVQEAVMAMDMIRFLLISPTSSERRVEEGGAPNRSTKVFRFSMLPSLYVAASMPDIVQTRIMDEDVEPIDFQADADLVGITCMTCNAVRAYEVADRFRARGIPVMMGGYHPTFMPKEALEHCDAVCAGEAETVAHRMIEDFSAGRMSGVYDGGLADVKGLPMPDRSLLKQGAYLTTSTLQATRGCPHACTFCSVSRFHHRRHRCRPVDEVIEELKQLGRYVLFQDDNLTASPYYAKELFRRMIPLKKLWFSQVSARITEDAELLDLARRSGCRGLFIGYESLSPEALKASKKSANLKNDYATGIKRLHDAGIAIYSAFVFGLDGDDESVFRTTLEFALRNNLDFMQSTILTPYPGTELLETMEKEGRILNRDWNDYDAGHVVYQPQNMSAEALKNGHRWVQTQFYSRRAILTRTARSLRYLDRDTLKVTIPVSIGCRRRLVNKGLYDDAKRYHPMA